MITVNDLPVSVTTFPGGEVKVVLPEKLQPGVAEVVVVARLYNSEAVMALVMVTNALRHRFRMQHNLRFALVLPYFPYARQDRVCNPGESHGVQAMAGLVNSLNYDEVTIADPHSVAVQAAVNNCVAVSLTVGAKAMLSDLVLKKKYELVSPDAGAEKKVEELAKAMSSWGLAPKVHCAYKVRNVVTGEILSTKLMSDVEGKDLVIVDDICDGGRTFIELAKVLKKAGAKQLVLFVTHGIFSAGLDKLKEYFEAVYCVHSFSEPPSEFLKVKEK